MKYLNKIRENCLLFLLGVRLSTASKVELLVAAEAEGCGGPCICVTPNQVGATDSPTLVVNLSEAPCGVCPSGSAAATNTKC